jgi:hypothetical protein
MSTSEAEMAPERTLIAGHVADVAPSLPPELTVTRTEHVTMLPLRKSRLPLFATPARRAFIAACAALVTFVVTNPSDGQTGQTPGSSSGAPANAQQYPPPLNPETLSCNELKARLKNAGELTILVGPRGGWGDTFYGPAAPRCPFWQMPLFTYVRANDGLCGLGYICVEKLSRD